MIDCHAGFLVGHFVLGFFVSAISSPNKFVFMVCLTFATFQLSALTRSNNMPFRQSVPSTVCLPRLT